MRTIRPAGGTVAARFAAHVLGLRFADLPAPVVAAAKTFILDSLGVGLAGAAVEEASRLHRVAAGWGAAAEATAWGHAARLPAAGAAFLNAWQMHNQEYDCLHEGGVVHVMANVLPAALAAAERRGGVSGAELITAVAAGVDVAAGLGLAARAGMRFFRPATAGGFGATAAAGRLLGLDQAGLERAFAFQLAQAGGTMQAHLEASPVLAMQVGLNAAAALRSCELATIDLVPPRAVFEGPFGYLALFEGGGDLEPVLDGLGRRFLIAELSHKPYPAGRATHGGIEGVLALRAAHGFTADQVEAVEVSAPPLIRRLVGRPDVPDPAPAQARLCMAYVVAKALLHGELRLEHFRAASLRDRATHALAARVRTLDDGTDDPNALAPQRVTVRLSDGRELVWHAPALLAGPGRGWDRARQLAKIGACVGFLGPVGEKIDLDRLIFVLDGLDSCPDIREMLAMLAPEHRGGLDA